MKFKFLYEGSMLDIEAETSSDKKLLNSLRNCDAQILANAKFKFSNRRALILTFPQKEAVPVLEV